MIPVIQEFSSLKLKADIYKNKNKCLVLKNCIIDLSEFSNHIIDDQSNNIKVYSNNYRVRKYINRNPETNTLWYTDKEVSLNLQILLKN